MPQGPLAVSTGAGGSNSVLNINAPVTVKAGPGRLARVAVITPGSAGTLTINDAASVGAATAANTILAEAFNATGFVAGTVYNLDWPCLAGITISGVPTGGVVNVSFT